MSEAFLTRFNFAVEVTVSGFGGDEGLAQGSPHAARGAFSEVSGLELNIEMQALREGGYNAGVRQLAGKVSSPPLVLKRGVTLDDAFWAWIRRCTDGTFPLPYVSGAVTVFGPEGEGGEPRASWSFTRGLVTKVRSADLSAGSAREVAIEELHIAHEGLMREEGP
ncbi:phage tail protein [Falsiroseomonas oryzae]|uniref:phage tail protein n=1 Tax=Falsiroseomonas oryzae TaxID=2766473 RepID=UPI0022EA1F02|nr:phage tail protein [Roseomonas sp. MO-31]